MIISIIIPTRERAVYLRESVRTALQIPDRDIEIVVSDNASTDGTRQVMEEIFDPRVKYVNTGRRVSMRENFEFGMRNSNGDYVIFFGDDDGILPRQFKFLRRILEDERPDVLRWNIPGFGWPNFDPLAKEHNNTGSVMFNKRKLFGGIHQIDDNAQRNHLLVGDLNRIELPPVIYHGCVSRDYFTRMATSDGTYFNGSSPDVYFCYRSILEGGKFIHADHAFSLGGFSPASIGAAGERQAHGTADNPQDEPAYRHIMEYKQDRITDIVPPFHFAHPASFFFILETVRMRFPGKVQVPDYLAWYNHILSEDSPRRDAVEKVVKDYAEKSGTLSEFHQAESRQTTKHTPKTTKKCCLTLRMVFSEIKDTLRNYATRSPILPNSNRFRLSAELARENTILTAVHIYDEILADDYGHILDGEVTGKSVWKQTVKRSLAYPLRKQRNL
uniref:Glycosyl transferase family 2 n=1 Tax=Candidatus Kentrum sp. MB TaxID=2138164 RepID=A0A450X224_9GAMM|nr:MAG: Glycosyl transferase family 2 [Candidatus Kentron sp. MB]VFK28447.1 MAG: Glycosyl transferase family 2 [Candidatus Kentron sp. MB]VFK74257.1 MAG: Glycosyl transferase family 2 [Candidatus Kentron sp. MB]